MPWPAIIITAILALTAATPILVGYLMARNDARKLLESAGWDDMAPIEIPERKK